MPSTKTMNPKNPPIPEVLDAPSLRGFLFLGFFGALIAAKCSASEALRLYYGFEVNTALYIWLPSLVLGGIVCLLYIVGPGSAFHPYWKSKQFLVPAALIWITVSFSIVRQLPSVVVPASLSILFAVVSLVLGRFYQSIPIQFLAAIWLLGALISFLAPPILTFSVFAVLLISAGSVPAGVGYLQLRRAARSKSTAPN
ncbi:MAG: hypothetical protein ACQKBT_08795 [Puniceicoccales bacterium]